MRVTLQLAISVSNRVNGMQSLGLLVACARLVTTAQQVLPIHVMQVNTVTKKS